MDQGKGFAAARRALIATAAAALALSFTACGDDDDESTTAAEETTETESTASAEDVTVTATEYMFDLSATPTVDTKNVTFTNDGKEFHVMIFARINEGFTVDEAIKLEGEKGSAEIVAQTEAEPGQTSEAKVKAPIEAGEYAMLCPVGGPQGPHYKLGQLEEFSIE